LLNIHFGFLKEIHFYHTLEKTIGWFNKGGIVLIIRFVGHNINVIFNHISKEIREKEVLVLDTSLMIMTKFKRLIK